jgi:hypothetical protein
MDYNTALENCDDIVRVHVPSQEELQERISAGLKWYPDDAPKFSKYVGQSRNAEIEADDLDIGLNQNGPTQVELRCRKKQAI